MLITCDVGILLDPYTVSYPVVILRPFFLYALAFGISGEAYPN